MKMLNLKTLVAAASLALLSSSAFAGTNNGAFQVQATVGNDCSVSADGFVWADVGLFNRNYDTTGTIKVTCVGGTAYTVTGSDTGLPAGRDLTNGSKKIYYKIYTDAGYSLEIPHDSTTALAAGTASGNEDSTTVYGRIYPQSMGSGAVWAGLTYTDAANIRVNF